MPTLQQKPTITSDPYQSEILLAAETLCADSPAVTMRRPRLLSLRALMIARCFGYLDAAIAYAMHAVKSEPDRIASWVDLGDLLSRKRRPEAIGAYLRALKFAPNVQGLYVRLGRALYQQGQLPEAAAIYREALRLQPCCAHTYGEIGDILFAQGRSSDEAIELYEIGLRLDPCDPSLHLRLGRVRLARHEWHLALRSFRRGLQLNPEGAAFHVGLGVALLNLGYSDNAIQAFRTALEFDPTDIEASRQLLLVFELLRHKAGAAVAWFHFGSALQAHLRYDEAAIAYRQSIALEPGFARALAGLAHVHLASGRPRDSLPWVRAALAQAPRDTAAHIDLATAYHLLGKIEDGWNEFAWFYDSHELRRRGFECQIWDGSPLNGRTILLWTDMGRGDTIHFLRYISAVRDAGGRIVVQCHHPRLVPFVERIAGVERVIVPGTPLPQVDVHAPLTFFPAFFRTHRSARNCVPYLSVEPSLAASWRQKLGYHPGKTIGLSWGGNAETRSAPARFVTLAAFASLGNLRGSRFVSVQHGPQAAELLSLPRGLRVERVLGDSSSITDAAALILSLDLVITVDTMIAHLAGALARPVWTLLRYATNWLWQMEGERTPWYSTMRLFRQTQPGDWTDVFKRVRAALENDSDGLAGR